MEPVYNRIPCKVYDHFEIAAMRRKLVKLRYKDEAGNELNIEDNLVDMKTKDKVEYAVMKSGLMIRLDWIFELDELVIQDVKGCYL